ncbi:M48 family metallopeptidase [Roseovarius sp. PS-C2]|uniref:M48 family metallopeptidase n=1 Tax=Roseovarius sp. PS-C2 TaxID=2820814 RepID=UPI001C0C930A|nr:SprT family zinc-dependent metalloprotease [Roseovarius sp. PS-C2]MBU3260772.1 M48 family metallopeptidase [Roseovarius sp. PS-C2]
MGEHILPGNPPVELTLRRSSRARRISLRVSRLDGRVTLTLPQGVRSAAALDFARSKEDWLRAQLQAQPQMTAVAMGAEIPVEGRLRRIIPASGRRVVLAENELAVPGAADNIAVRLQAWLKTLARDRLAAASDRYAQALGRPYARITLRDTRSRWGSCSSNGGLMYSWRLIMAAPEVLDYVAAHEVAHLAEMNHSPAFWAHVARLYPGYEGPRRWLRDHGSDLHRYRFDD